MSREPEMSNRQVLTYLGAIFAVSWLLQLCAIFITSDIDSEEAEIWLVLTMFVPALVTIIFLFVFKPLRSRLLWKPNLKVFAMILAGILVPTIIAFAVLTFLQLMGYGQSGWFDFSTSGVQVSGGPWVLGTANQSWAFFLANILATGVVFSVLNGIPAAGEEFAWRGFLQGILIGKLGRAKGIIVLGLIWSFWHLPALLAGYNFPEHPIIGGFIISPIELVAVSFFLAWLTLSCKSFIPAAIAHGAGNSIQEGVIANIKLSVPGIYEDLTTLCITVVIGLVFWYLISKSDP